MSLSRWLSVVRGWSGRRQVTCVTLLLTLAAAWVRSYRCNESVHTDTLIWYDLTQRFWVAIEAGKFSRTYQGPHPGVTLMWMSGAIMNLDGLLGRPIDVNGLFALKLPGILIGTLSAALTFPLGIACFGKSQWRAALVLSALWVTEPTLVEQSRMALLDVPALGFAWLGLLLAIIAYERDSYGAALGAGALFGAATLTRLSAAPIPAALMLVLTGTSLLSRFRDRRGLKVAALATLAAVVTAFAIWPALWTSPVTTLSRMLASTRELVNHGHMHRFQGVRTRDPGIAYYWESVRSVMPFETGLLALLGIGVVGFVRPLRKHYLWLMLAFVPYLVLTEISPKKLTRYALPATGVFLLLAGVAIEWLVSISRQRLKQATIVVPAVLSLMFVARYARAVRLLPVVHQCTSWPGVTCGRPPEMYYMRELALLIADDWQRQHGRGKPSVYVRRPELMSPWLRARSAHSPRRADYVIVWDEQYADSESGKLLPDVEKLFGRLGTEVATLRDAGTVVARVNRVAN